MATVELAGKSYYMHPEGHKQEKTSRWERYFLEKKVFIQQSNYQGLLATTLKLVSSTVIEIE